MKVNSFDDLAELILSDKLTNKQVNKVVQNSMGLLLSFDEEKLPREELVNRLKEFNDKWLVTGHKITPLFLNLNLDTI